MVAEIALPWPARSRLFSASVRGSEDMCLALLPVTYAIGRNQQVFRLQITVEEPMAVHVYYPCQQLVAIFTSFEALSQQSELARTSNASTRATPQQPGE